MPARAPSDPYDLHRREELASPAYSIAECSKGPLGPLRCRPGSLLVMSSHERDRLTRDHRDPEIALFVLYKETPDALISLTEANTLLLRIYLPRR